MCTKMMMAVFCTLMITACGAGGGAADKAASTGGGSTPALTPPTTPVTGGVDPVLVVYSKTVTKSITSGGVNYSVPMTGFCAVYNSNTYCWDDGWHRPIASLGYDYWGFILSGSTILQGSEGMAAATDPLLNTPTMVTTAFVNQLPGNVINPDGSETTMVSTLLATGTQSQVNCTDDGISTLTCPTFTLVY